MSNQVIVTISREFESGGHIVARKIAEDLGFELYDRNLLDKLAENMNVDAGYLEKFDEKPKNPLFAKRRGEHSNSMEENLAQMQFDFLRQKAESGNSMVIVGRCGETVFKDHEGLISIFIVGDRDYKIKRTMERYQLSESKAIAKMNRHDIKRKYYHNSHSYFKWGDSRYYDMCINSSRLGLDKTAEVLEDYIRARM